MNWSRQTFFLLVVLAVFPAIAQMPPPPFLKFSTSTNSAPPLPQAVSPVGYFRQLLAMAPKERLNSLTNRPPAVRERILAKVREYQALDADERELRLRATELRWFLTPLLRLPASGREARLAQVPVELRGLVETRLRQWDILPPPLQKEFLENDRALHYFAHVETTNPPAADEPHQNAINQINQFFELTPAEKAQALNTLSATEQAQMEKTLKAFEQLPPPQRFQCIRNYAKFTGMSVAERTEFLKNAEHWSKMSPKERQTWRDLVTHIPQWPPMPPAIIPPNLIPHAAPKPLRPTVATNSQ